MTYRNLKYILFSMVFLIGFLIGGTCEAINLSEDFESYTTLYGYSMGGWSKIGDGDVKIITLNGNKCMALEPAEIAQVSRARVIRQINTNDDIISFKFKFMCPQKGDITQLMQLAMQPYHSYDEVIFELMCKNGNLMFTCREFNEALITEYTIGKWYEIEVEICLTDQQLGVYVDGKRKFEHKNLMVGKDCTGITRISTYSDAAPYYIDDIQMKTGAPRKTELTGIPKSIDVTATQKNIISPELNFYTKNRMKIKKIPVIWDLPAGFSQTEDGSIILANNIRSGNYTIKGYTGREGYAEISSDLSVKKEEDIVVNAYFADVNGNRLGTVLNNTSGNFKAKISAYNNTTARKLTVFLAEYAHDGTLEALTMKSISISGQSSKNIEYDVAAKEDKTLKLFCWNDTIKSLESKIIGEPDLVVCEKAGVDGMSLIRRGIPFEKGAVQNPDEIILVDSDGNYVPSVNKVLEHYEDGSVKWLSTAFVDKFETYSRKKYYIERGTFKREKNIAYPSGSNIILDNGIIQAVIDSDGKITVLRNGSVAGNNIRPFTDSSGNKEFLEDAEVEIIDNSDVYSTVRISGNIGTVHSDLYITLGNGMNTLSAELRFTAMADITLNSEGMLFESTGTQIKADRGVLGLYNSGTNISTVFVSDACRQYSDINDNGGIYTDQAIVYFSPIQWEKPYLWLDGISKTLRFHISADIGRISASECVKKLDVMENPICASVNPEIFEKLGYINQAQTNVFTDRLSEQIKSSFTSTLGGFESGYVPYAISNRTSNLKPEDNVRHEGEAEYNLWFWCMMTQDMEMFNILDKSTEFWADMYIYKGSHDELKGANRYKLDTEYGQRESKMSQPYYGDSSGIYFSWLMTGNPYYKEIFDMCIEHTYRGVEKNGFPLVSFWDGDAPQLYDWPTGARIRFAIQARSLYLASQTTGNEKYAAAADKISKWVIKHQEKEGFWYQAYSVNHNPIPQREGAEPAYSQPAVKNYIMLYGMRGFIEYAHMANNTEPQECIDKFADWILSEIGEKGEMWEPVSDMKYYAITPNESAITACLSITVMRQMYEKTGDTKYLEAMCRLLRFYISVTGTWRESTHIGNDKANFLKEMTIIPKLLKDHAKQVADLGYYDLLYLFDGTAKEIDNPYEYDRGEDEFAVHMYDASGGDVITFGVCARDAYSNKRAEAYKSYEFPMTERRLWSNTRNIINEGGITISGSLNGVDTRTCVSLPITAESGKAVVESAAYLSGKVIELVIKVEEPTLLRLTAEATGYTIGNPVQKLRGTEGTEANDYYTIQLSPNENDVRVLIYLK